MGTGVLPSLPPYSPDVKEWSSTFNKKVKVKQSHYRPGQALGVPEG